MRLMFDGGVHCVFICKEVINEFGCDLFHCDHL